MNLNAWLVFVVAEQLAYGGLAGRLGRFARNPRFARWTDRIAGSFPIAAGLGMAAIRETE